MKFRFIEKMFCKHKWYFIPYVGNVSHFCCRKCGKVKKF